MNFLSDDHGKKHDLRKGKVGMFLTSRQISWVLSLFVLMAFFIFIAGYFLGEKKAAEKFYQKVGQESLADHIYYSVCSMHENKDVSTQGDSTEDDGVSDELAEESDFANGSSKNSIKRDSAEDQEDAEGDIIATTEPGCNNDYSIEKNKVEQENKKYYAELVGFGSHINANRFANKLNHQDLSVKVKTRRSKTAKGRTITWYQVVTNKFDNKNDLIAFVDIIKEKERLKDVRIIQC